jgi:undecaprenyl-diphosphatase
MTSPDEGDKDGDNRPAHFLSPLVVRFLSLACSCTALALVFVGLVQFDLPIVRYVRSVTIHLPWDQLTIPWMAFTSNTGDWIGDGWRLVAISVALLVVGLFFSKPILKTAGIKTLLAHGIAALLSNGLKHLVGRPRPKFVHSGEWQFTPSWVSGLDSFPSGHTTGSFAVATVLAKQFPAFGPLCLSVAAFVALSRVLRGAHFPTDVMAGAVLGVLSGSIASAPLKQWSTSFQDGLRQAAIGTCAVFALLWTLSHQVDEEIAGALLVGLGAVATASGLWLRRTNWIGKEKSVKDWQANVSLALIAYGLAAMTTSPLVLAAVGFACLASWFNGTVASEEQSQDSHAWLMMRESVLLGGVLLALLILYDGRGVFSFQ